MTTIYVAYNAFLAETIAAAPSMDRAISAALRHVQSEGYTITDFSYDEVYTVIECNTYIGNSRLEKIAISVMETSFEK